MGVTDYVGNLCSNCDPTDGSTTTSWNNDFLTRQDGVFLQTLMREGSGGNLSVVRFTPRTLDQITDGLTNTVCIAEKRVLAAAEACNDSLGWTSGVAAKRNSQTVGMDTLFSGLEGAPARDETSASVTCTSRAGGPHVRGGNVLYCDGHVEFKSFGMVDNVWRATLSASKCEDVDVQNDRLVKAF
jgi:prepilin-type processing-associated H-X9-DG protein